MGYNPFRWYTSGKYRKRPLKSNAPLLLKIQNGDFELSPFYQEAKDNDKLYKKMYDEYVFERYKGSAPATSLERIYGKNHWRDREERALLKIYTGGIKKK